MRVIGSKGFTTSARSVLAVGEHPDNEGESLLVLRKSNFIDRRAVPALRYRVEGREVDHRDIGMIATAGVAWLGETLDVDADSILSSTTSEERTERDEAAEWLADLLVGGPRPYKEVERLAAEVGIARATLHRARKTAGVRVTRDEAAQGRPSRWGLSSQPLTQHSETKDLRENASRINLSSHGVSSQPLTQPSETKHLPPLSRENAPRVGVSSHVTESETKGGEQLSREDVSRTNLSSHATESEWPSPNSHKIAHLVSAGQSDDSDQVCNLVGDKGNLVESPGDEPLSVAEIAKAFDAEVVETS